MNLGERFTRETTTPGTSPSSISWSTRANVTVNSYCENVMFAKLAYDPAICSGSRWMLSWRSWPSRSTCANYPPAVETATVRRLAYAGTAQVIALGPGAVGFRHFLPEP